MYSDFFIFLYRSFLFFGRFSCAIFCFFCCFYHTSSVAMPGVLQQAIATQSNWHCGPDEDGCTDSGCLCIPVSTHQSAAYCLDLDDIDRPCKPQQSAPHMHGVAQSQCGPGQTPMPSQQACLNEYFSGGHCTKDDPRSTCNMQCNAYGGQCKLIP